MRRFFISPIILEKPGKWRLLLLAGLFGAVIFPIIPLLFSTLSDGSSSSLGPDFFRLLIKSLGLVVTVSLGSLILGFPLGLLTGLYKFRTRRLFLILIAVPLILPSFLWAIGISNVVTWLGISPMGGTGSFVLTVISFICQGFPLIFFSVFLACRGLAKSQVESLRVHGSSWLLVRQSAKASYKIAILAATLIAANTMSDPGPPQIFGIRSVASEILVSFSALYDFNLATYQSLMIAAFCLVIILPAIAVGSRDIARALLSRDISSHQLISFSQRNEGIVMWVFWSLWGVIFGLPVVGLIFRAQFSQIINRAFNEIVSTSADSLIFSLGSATVATIFAVILAMVTLRRHLLSSFVLIACLSLLALPPTLNALGLIKIGSLVPSTFDFFFRSKFTVCFALGIRFFPIAFFFILRQIHQSSSTWVMSAAIHRLSLRKTILKLFIPFLLPSIFTGFVSCALLSLSEVGSLILLRPPGTDSIVSRVFTIMANAPESLVASMCLLIVFLATIAMGTISWISKGKT